MYGDQIRIIKQCVWAWPASQNKIESLPVTMNMTTGGPQLSWLTTMPVHANHSYKPLLTRIDIKGTQVGVAAAGFLQHYR